MNIGWTYLGLDPTTSHRHWPSLCPWSGLQNHGMVQISRRPHVLPHKTLLSVQCKGCKGWNRVRHTSAFLPKRVCQFTSILFLAWIVCGSEYGTYNSSKTNIFFSSSASSRIAIFSSSYFIYLTVPQQASGLAFLIHNCLTQYRTFPIQ